jgi:hypothetical protein
LKSFKDYINEATNKNLKFEEREQIPNLIKKISGVEAAGIVDIWPKDNWVNVEIVLKGTPRQIGMSKHGGFVTAYTDVDYVKIRNKVKKMLVGLGASAIALDDFPKKVKDKHEDGEPGWFFDQNSFRIEFRLYGE